MGKKKLMVELGEENIELHLDHFITELLPKIRFPMMTPAQLADLLLNPLSQTHTELLVERIRMAMCYHKNQLDISEKGRVPERVLKTVRVSVSTRSQESQRVRIGLLMIGNQDNFEHVRSVATRNYFFSEDDQIVNFDDILDYDELNDLKEKSPFISGDSLKLLIVIAPLS